MMWVLLVLMVGVFVPVVVGGLIEMNTLGTWTGGGNQKQEEPSVSESPPAPKPHGPLPLPPADVDWNPDLSRRSRSGDPDNINVYSWLEEQPAEDTPPPPRNVSGVSSERYNGDLVAPVHIGRGRLV